MTISLNAAQGALLALQNQFRNNAFGTIAANGKHLFAKHTSKQDALQGAKESGTEQGYFKRVDTVTVNKAQYNEWAKAEREGQTSKATKYLATKGIDNLITSKQFKPSLAGTMDVNKPIGDDDYMTIIRAILFEPDPVFCRSRANPDDRFVLLAYMPDGYVGRAIEPNGTKHKDVTDALMVIRARPQPVGIVTVFPAAPWYVEDLVKLR